MTRGSPKAEPSHEVRVVATAGHVDHGKSALITRLTGIDPDRLEEEKRRGLTIELGYAWCTLPSGREIAFVDVPGHERFIRTMLAGVGPVRSVLFVVAADEGWRRQSEEHLQIVDVLGATAGVVALTKRDLVDAETLTIAEREVRERLDGTALGGARIVPVSSRTGQGIDELVVALDDALAGVPPPPPGRTRLFVDRAFTVHGAGTVVTGTLTGGCLEVGDEVELLPSGARARIRGLQSHGRSVERACPVSRVAVNLAGIDRTQVHRGEVLVEPGRWRSTSVLDARLAGVRGVDLPIGGRGAWRVHVGSADAEARLRVLGQADGGVYARVVLRHPLVVEPGDRFVLREVGRRATVAGGLVLDPAPSRAASAVALDRLRARARAEPDQLPGLLVAERGAVRAEEIEILTGRASERETVSGWIVEPRVRDRVQEAACEALADAHENAPLSEGLSLDEIRRIVERALAEAGAPTERALADALLEDLVAREIVRRGATTVRLAGHRVALDAHAEELRRLVEAISGPREAAPPEVDDLVRSGFDPQVIEAAARAGLVVRIAPRIVVSPGLVERAVRLVAEHAAEGVTVSALREALGTTRKYAVPLLEHLDRTGATRRVGDLRFPRRSP
jgi:selenocysteine-specific elongation factor